MYINTQMFEAKNGPGWYHITKQVSMDVEMVLEPSGNSSDGQSKMRTWMRKGFCDRPTGTYAAYWTMLMYKAGAEYLMMVDSGGANISLLNPAKRKQWENKLADFHALGLLVREANTSNHPFVIPTDLHPREWDRVVVPKHGRESDGYLRFYVGGKQRMLVAKAFVETMGHPLPDVKQALPLVAQPHPAA
jgi:hypothetical protein